MYSQSNEGEFDLHSFSLILSEVTIGLGVLWVQKRN